ncbi:MAG: hypothetical protein AAGA48_35740 [Myxococcota bacterium]
MLRAWLVSLAFVACSGGTDPESTTPDPSTSGPTGPGPTDDPTKPLEFADTVEGPAQKGPFLKGSAVSAQELGAQGQPTGSSVTGSVNDEGRYSLSGLTWEAPTWLEVSGQVLDEIECEPSYGSFTLNAAVLPVKGRTSAINLFTDLAAHRIATLMAAGDEFETAQATAIAEMTPLWGLSNRPEDLDVFGGPGNDGEELDLLLYSAAAMDERLEQDEWVELREDFADDGLLNGAGLRLHTDIVETIQADPADLLDTAQRCLAKDYETLPPVTDGNLGFFLNGCLGAYLLRPDRVVCEGLDTEFSLGSGDTVSLQWIPDLPGLHVALIFQPCSSGTYAFGTTNGALSSGSFTEFTLETRDTPSEAPIDWGLTSGCSGNETFSVAAIRTSDGSANAPLELTFGAEFDGRVSNEFFGPSRIAHYVVQGAASRVTVFDFNSGTGLNAQNFMVRVFDSPDERTQTLLASDDGVAFKELTFAPKGNQTYIQVINSAAQAVPQTYAQFSITVE